MGSLALDRASPAFEFARAWLADPLPLAPRTFAPAAGLVHGPRNMPERLHGLFADSLPDAWGRALAGRYFALAGLAREQITLLDRLAHVGDRGMGALIYAPADDGNSAPFVPDLDALSDEAHRVLEGSATEVLAQLMAAAGSSGGARPKVLVGIGPGDAMIANAADLPPRYDGYLVKFSLRSDATDAGAVEFAYSSMAAAAGLRTSDARLLTGARGARYFAVRRFDRGPRGLRIHMLTASGLLDLAPDYFALDYGDLGAELVRVCEDYREGREFARRMVFNVLAHNRDDHLKNTALLMDRTGAWTLSPAYDLTPMPGPNGEHSMLVAGEGRAPTETHLVTAGEAMGVERGPMREIIARVDMAVSQWDTFADEAGVASARRREVARLLRATRKFVFARPAGSRARSP